MVFKKYYFLLQINLSLRLQVQKKQFFVFKSRIFAITPFAFSSHFLIFAKNGNLLSDTDLRADVNSHSQLFKKLPFSARSGVLPLTRLFAKAIDSNFSHFILFSSYVEFFMCPDFYRLNIFNWKKVS